MAELTVPQIDFSILGNLPQTYRSARDDATKQRQEEARRMTLAELGQGDGPLDTADASRKLLAAGDLEGAMSLARLGQTDTTDTLKNVAAENKMRAARGLPPLSPMEYSAGIRRAGANSTTINMPPGEKAYDTEMGKELAGLNVGIMKGAATAHNNLNNIDRLEQLLQQPGVYQGTAGNTILEAKKLAKSLGIDVGEGVGGAEAARAITNQLALNARNPAGGAGMPGAMSDADREYLKAMQPGIEATPQGNKLIIDTNRKLNQRAIQVEKFRQEYIKKHGRLNEGFYSALSEWSNANPLFPAGPPKTAAQQPAAAPSEGATATNKQTGQRIIFRGGQWVPLQ